MSTHSSGEGALIEPADGLSYVRGSTENPLSEATVGVAMGAGTDVARESADVVLIGNDLSKFVETVRIAKNCVTTWLVVEAKLRRASAGEARRYPRMRVPT